MATLQIKNLPEPVHAELRRRATQSRTTVRDYVLRLIEADQSLPSRVDWLAELGRDERVLFGGSASDLIHEGRAERDAEIDRGVGGR